MLDADASGTPLLDFAPTSPVVEAIQQVCDTLVPRERQVRLMCVGIPAQVVEILAEEKKSAIVEVEGVRREVSIVIVLDDGVKVGDWVLLHVGFAMSIIDEEEAAAQLDFMRLLGSVYDEEVEAFSAEVPLVTDNAAGGIRSVITSHLDLDSTSALELARVFASGGRLVVTAQGREDHARHVAVEFIHPAITGARIAAGRWRSGSASFPLRRPQAMPCW